MESIYMVISNKDLTNKIYHRWALKASKSVDPLITLSLIISKTILSNQHISKSDTDLATDPAGVSC